MSDTKTASPYVTPVSGGGINPGVLLPGIIIVIILVIIGYVYNMYQDPTRGFSVREYFKRFTMLQSKLIGTSAS